MKISRILEYILMIIGILTIIVMTNASIGVVNQWTTDYDRMIKGSTTPTEFTYENTRSETDPWINYTSDTLAHLAKFYVPSDFVNLTEQQFVIWKNCSDGATYGGGNVILKSNSTGTGPDFGDYLTAGEEGRYFVWQFNNSDPANHDNGSYIVSCTPNATYWSSNGGGLLLNNTDTPYGIWWIVVPAHGYEDLFTAVGNASNSIGFKMNSIFEFEKCNTPYILVQGEAISITVPTVEEEEDDDDDDNSSDEDDVPVPIMSIDQIIALLGIVLPALGVILAALLAKERQVMKKVKRVESKFEKFKKKMKELRLF